MKKINDILLCCFFVFLPLTATAQKQLTILHTNDTHSTIMPLNPNLEDTMKAGRGGDLRRINMLKEERRKDPDLLLFDSGDFSQGSGYYTMFKGDVEVGLMNEMHYDAATIGNHEFDFGLDNMARLFKMAQFPIVCTNYDFTQELPWSEVSGPRQGGTGDRHHAEKGHEVRHGDLHLALRMGYGWRR